MNSRFGDTTYTKVFVGGLAWETQSHTLRRHFEQYGDILEAVVISDKNTGCSKGYGFVTFRDADSARRACAHPNPYIHGRRANCNLASLGRPPPPVSSFASPVHRAASSDHHLPYAYQPAFVYPPHGYSMYGSDYVYSQGFYNPYVHQYVQLYGMPGAATVSPGLISRGQFSQPIPGYSTGPTSAMPAHQLIRSAGLSHGMPSTTANQAPDPSGYTRRKPGTYNIVF